MSVVNSVHLIGNLGADPIVKNLDNGNKIVNFSIATKGGYKDKTTGKWVDKPAWHNCVAYGYEANSIAAHVKKGSSIAIAGELTPSTWNDKETGKKRYKTEVKVDSWTFQSGKGGSSSNESQVNSGGSVDEDMPF